MELALRVADCLVAEKPDMNTRGSPSTRGPRELSLPTSSGSCLTLLIAVQHLAVKKLKDTSG